MRAACDGGGKDTEAVLRYDALEELVASCGWRSQCGAL